MTREEKSKVIENLTTQLSENPIIYLADISSLNANSTTNLRRACFKAGVKLEVVKNTLLTCHLRQLLRREKVPTTSGNQWLYKYWITQ